MNVLRAERIEEAASISRHDYTEWTLSAAALAEALRYSVQPSMVNDSTGIVFGDSQYKAFRNGLWSREPYEVMIIFEALNEPAVDGLPRDSATFAEYGGLCDKLMILHPGKFCPPHYHPRKTESYEVLMGTMEVFYCPSSVSPRNDRLSVANMPAGDRWPVKVDLPLGRESSYEQLSSFTSLRPGDPKFVMHRNHLHAFRCPPDSTTPLVVREISTYSHEPTEASREKPVPLESWQAINDNVFVNESANEGRLVTKISS